jgi:hypothetical protein
MHIQPFIFNWKGQYEKTSEKEKQLNRIITNTKVINSDEQLFKPAWHNIGEQAYFSRQFQTAIDLFDADVFFHVQGDASYHNWVGVLAHAVKYFPTYNWGIYAPNVDYTYHVASRVNINSLSCKDKHLHVVSCTDCTCWLIHKDIITMFRKRNIDLSISTYGWGIAVIFSALSFICNRPVLRDYNHTVIHPGGTGYPKGEAMTQMHRLFATLDPELKEAVHCVRSNKERLADYIL